MAELVYRAPGKEWPWHWSEDVVYASGPVPASACNGQPVATWDSVAPGQVDPRDRCRGHACASKWRAWDATWKPVDTTT